MEHPNNNHSTRNTSTAFAQAVQQAQNAWQQAGSQIQAWVQNLHTQPSKLQATQTNSSQLLGSHIAKTACQNKTIQDRPTIPFMTTQPRHGLQQTITGQTVFNQATTTTALPFASINSLPPNINTGNGLQANHVTSDARKAELGRSTWTLLHMLAAQYPDKPTRQQKRDVKQFIDSLTRVYPCGSCASHFSQIVRRSPPNVNSRQELQMWMCRVHNIVNRSIGKPEFNCEVSHHRWEPLDCGPDGLDGASVSACDMSLGSRTKTGSHRR